MSVDETAGWLTRRSPGAILLLGGGVLAVLGFQLIELGGTDPDSLLAYVGGASLLLGQLAAVLGLADVCWHFLRNRK